MSGGYILIDDTFRWIVCVATTLSWVIEHFRHQNENKEKKLLKSKKESERERKEREKKKERKKKKKRKRKEKEEEKETMKKKLWEEKKNLGGGEIPPPRGEIWGTLPLPKCEIQFRSLG